MFCFIFKMYSCNIFTVFFMMALFYFFLLLSSPAITMSTGTRGVVVAAAARPLKSANYATFKTKTTHEPDKFGSRSGVDDCLPKGIHRNSAPSRYTNYHNSGSTMCSTPKEATATSKP
ncbi:Maintenance of mitochondrial morphology protein like [Melia azedarach]|uniref:Maintenance of mitochondrial morphology protein like n=1 Tax=Melia azedarach TaxID=155640 RepID=A0ACC1YAZ6_MELAZ|nr:Maintenance of mitochondrial morphology protein like [Melia azedarach]